MVLRGLGEAMREPAPTDFLDPVVGADVAQSGGGGGGGGGG